MPSKADQSAPSLPKEIQGRVPVLSTIAMPADTNPNGDIFGGWIMSYMDMAGGAKAFEFAGKRVVTRAVSEMSFHKPVFVGDKVSFYADITRVGNTSMTIKIESWALRRTSREIEKVTEGTFTFVALGGDRKPEPIKKKAKK